MIHTDLRPLFQEIRDIPYRIPLSLAEVDDCCSGKHRRLKAELEAHGLVVQWQVCRFRWSELSLPQVLLDIPHEDDSTHVYLRVLINDTWIDLDATWDAGLRTILPVNDWDGVSSTSIAVLEIERFSLEKSAEIMEEETPQEVEKDLKRNGAFYHVFNAWLAEVRK